MIFFFHSALGAVTYVDHGLLQYAGELGLASVGVGREFSRYSFAGMFGVVPAEISGANSIETFAIRQTYTFFEWERMHFHAGLNIFHAVGVSKESSRYGETPDDYYSISSVKAILNLGVSFHLDKLEKKFVYFEGGLNDVWMEGWLANYRAVNPIDHVSLAMGLKQRF